MSQIVLDDHLFPIEVGDPIRRWATVTYLRELRPGEVVKDDRVPSILREVGQTTFVTLDVGFWRAELCDSRYAILFFPFKDEQQPTIPALVRRLFRLAPFQTRQTRVGKVARVSPSEILFWSRGVSHLQHLHWNDEAR